MTKESLAYRRNKHDIQSGWPPEKFTRLMPYIPQVWNILEIGAAEGVLSLMMADRGGLVTALEMSRDRHEEALLLKETWLRLGKQVDNCEMVCGDIRKNYQLMDGVSTLVAIRVIYHLGHDIAAVFAEAGRRGIENVVLCGNAGRASGYNRVGAGPFDYYASVDGMSAVLRGAGYDVTQIVVTGDPIVVGRHQNIAV